MLLCAGGIDAALAFEVGAGFEHRVEERRRFVWLGTTGERALALPTSNATPTSLG